MASNSSAAAVAAMFGIRDADHQDQMKPLLAQQHQQLLPPAPLLNAAASSSAVSGQATGASPPPVKKKRNLPGNYSELCKYPFQFQPCIFSEWILTMHGAGIWCDFHRI